MKNLIEHVEQWAIDRDLHTQDPAKQYMKFAEEAGELASGIVKDNPEAIVDAFGDVLVTLIILNQQLREQSIIEEGLLDCLIFAFSEIKDRKGKTINGSFIKEDDLS